MTAVAFDTLKLARTLRVSANMSQEQAEGVADALAEAMSGAELATKSDLAAVAVELKGEIFVVKSDLAATAAELKAEIKASEHRLEAKLGEYRADTLKVIIGAMLFNSALILTAMFGLAKLLGH
ncbi:MAG: hypothetical protein WCJ64_02695 [Rhodospirillaceae bacterium]